jgi:hypothetical protein
MRLKQRGKEAAQRHGGPAERNGADLGRAGEQGVDTSEYGMALSSLTKSDKIDKSPEPCQFCFPLDTLLPPFQLAGDGESLKP